MALGILIALSSFHERLNESLDSTELARDFQSLTRSKASTNSSSNGLPGPKLSKTKYSTRRRVGTLCKSHRLPNGSLQITERRLRDTSGSVIAAFPATSPVREIGRSST